MLTDEVATFGESKPMKIAHLTLTLALATTVSACAMERVTASQPAATRVAALSPAMTQVPLLFVVDGVRMQRDQLPTLTTEQIASVEVLKGRAALKQYGPDASYGVVLITTKVAVAPTT
jgi:TonB-dependent SusC/RagA subfamily outer membrane receptor